MKTVDGTAEDEDIVISGISGVYPESDNLLELAENLFAKRDLVTEDDQRWKKDHPEIPQPIGKIRNLNKFDAAFFGVHAKQAHSMDPMSRILLEKTYEAIIDAGYNPKQFKGTKTGVFVGLSYTDSEKNVLYEAKGQDGCAVVGCSRALFANRISFWLDVNGPSYAVDTACSSSMYAFEHGYRAIKEGICDAAIVCGCNLCLHPNVSLSYARLGVIGPETRCKVFDESGRGYARSEAIVVMLLQRRKHSRRIYAKVVHAKSNNNGFVEQGITSPSGQQQARLMEEFYQECGRDPNTVDYFEAHGTGTKVGDPIEVAAIEKIFCRNRKRPLKIGSIKSNIGHAEPASGLCSISKLILSFELGRIPPNIHFKVPRSNIEALHNGKMKVVMESTPLEGTLAAVNNSGFGGANSHALFESHSKQKINDGRPSDPLPRLVVFSGRTEEAVDVILNDFERRPIDVEYIRLMHEIHSENIPGHLYRGYTLLNECGKLESHVEHYSGENRPVWFVFAGMGSHWPTMGRWLLRIPICAAALQECHDILKNKNVDLINIITTDDSTVFDSILNSFVAISATQVALIDLLEALDIRPDGLIGHSLGEVGCAYADGCFTKRQIMLSSYYRGVASLEVKLIRGMMASIGLGYESAKNVVPPEIDIACHNSANNCTISGPIEVTKNFADSLKEQNIFVREVNVSNIAYHSRYVADAGPIVHEYMKMVVPKPTRRRERWICTSLPECKWNTNEGLYSSAEYYTNNLLSPVYFEEACRHIPENAIVVEIAPHGLLQPILRRSLDQRITTIALTNRRSPDQMKYFFASLGKFFEAGGNAKFHKLYPPVEFPVSRGTPMISPLVRWHHSDDWFVPVYRQLDEGNQAGGRHVSVSLAQDSQKYLAGHCIDGRILYPAAGYIVLVWETFSQSIGRKYQEVPVVLEDIRFEKPLHVPSEGEAILKVNIQRGSGTFEITADESLLVTGKVYTPEEVDQEFVNIPTTPLQNGSTNCNEKHFIMLTGDDVYKELRLRGYNYTDQFKAITQVEDEGTYGRILWNNNYVTFLDNMFQFKILKDDTRNLKVPTSIQKIVIDPGKYLNYANSLDNQNSGVPVHLHSNLELVRCCGIEIQEMKTTSIARRSQNGKLVLQKHQFIPYHCSKPRSTRDILNVSVQLAIENLRDVNLKIVELVREEVKPEENVLASILVDIFEDIPTVQADIVIHTASQDSSFDSEEQRGIKVSNASLSNNEDCSMIVASNIVNDEQALLTCYQSLKPNGFLLAQEKYTSNVKMLYSSIGFNICSSFNYLERRFLLLHKIVNSEEVLSVVEMTNDSHSWIDEIRQKVNNANNQKLIIYSTRERRSGILGFFNCLKKELPSERLRCFFIVDEDTPEFSIDHPFYKTQLTKDLAVNVYKNGQWGSYRHVPLQTNDHVQTPHAYVTTLSRGDLTSLKWIEGPINPRQPGDKEIVHVYYAPLNFRDVMMATGGLATDTLLKCRLQGECTQGFEYAGKLANGQRVMGIVPSKGIASVVEGDEDLMWKVPDEWTLKEAATVPVVYATVLRALITCGRIKRGESILIHAGSGGVGQAAINVCLQLGCIVFTTVGTDLKRKFIRKHFASIPDDHIGNSRNTSFQQLIMRKTNGRGVDLVLNSLADNKLQASVRCLAHLGRFLEIGRVDIAKNSALGMKYFEREITFSSVLIDQFFYASTERKLELKAIVNEALATGLVKPLISEVFESNQVETAFRFMASGKHIGKVIIKMRDEESILTSPPEIKLREALPRYSCHPQKSYLICGGLGGFGLELADWLILRGARNIILTTRKGITSSYQAWRISLWKSYGVNVIVHVNSVSTEEDAKYLLQLVNKNGPVAGIFNLAVVLQDAIFENQNEKSFLAAWKPKVLTTMFLDKQSRQMCPELEHFVVFSSIVSGYGNVGQTNYGMANSAIERVCDARKADKLPALAIQWGAIADVGIVAKMAKDKTLVIAGTLPQSISSCLKTLDTLLKQSEPVVSCIIVADKRPQEEKANTVIDTVANILGIKNLKTVSMHSTLAELGIDSMMNIEIKQILDPEMKTSLSAQEIRRLTFSKLEEMFLVQKRKDVSLINGKSLRMKITNGETKNGLEGPLTEVPNS